MLSDPNSPSKKAVPMSPRVKCLLVDDLEENLLALSALLHREDVQILRARSGSEALELLLAHDVALAFLDVQMPEMDGFELAELMRGMERTRNVPIIFVTAGASDQHRVFKGYDAGAVDFLYKPLEPHVLRNKAEVFFQLHRQKQQLSEQLDELTETLRLNEMFTAVLGHDLRNPLSAIITGADLLQRRTEDEAVRKAAGRMLASGKRMGRMIEDVLDLARARLAGGIPLKREETDFGQLLHRIVQEHQAAWPERRIEVSQQGNSVGNWDPDRLAQVASNLIGNALQHGAPTEPIHIRLDGTRDDAITFSVENVGVIPDDMQQSLFDPFRSGQRQRGRKEGLGLGLYIVQQIAQAHQGEVTVESGTTRYTVFRVVLPRRGQDVVKL
ncbi:hybrid sensor histidine kinase/response regulator [Hyalangium minutum]|uniref:histidine kinase n=1 Tax=Hyalangium minutum TaxID=394096 RepID=A0A085WSQ9_9BACT|nr:hybrid sensor histidine kinase/response regulator [Hyalangium minutum]KFE70722.1 two-component hybrid sensor and regulator [Hyalangium minutum]